MNADRLAGFLLSTAAIFGAALMLWIQWPWIDQLPGYARLLFYLVQAGKAVTLYVAGYGAWYWAASDEQRWARIRRSMVIVSVIAAGFSGWYYVSQLQMMPSPLMPDQVINWASRPALVILTSTVLAFVSAVLCSCVKANRMLLVLPLFCWLIALWVELLHPWFWPLEYE